MNAVFSSPSSPQYVSSQVMTSAADAVQLSRQVFDVAVQWAMKPDKSLFWRTHRGSKSESPKDSLATVRSSGSSGSRNRTEE